MSYTRLSLRSLSSLLVGFHLVCLALASAHLPFAQEDRNRSGSPTDEVATYVGKGYDNMAKRRYNEAVREFQAALSLDPKLVQVRYQLAVCYFSLGQTKESRQEFDRLLVEAGRDPSVIYYLGRLDLEGGDIDSATRRLQSIVAHPPFPDTAYYLGSAYLKKGDLALAERWLREAVKQTPRDFLVHDHLARVYQKAGREVEAEKEYALSADLRHEYEFASQQAVACNQDLDTRPLAEARGTCQALFDRNDPHKMVTLGMLYGQHGDYADAVEPLSLAAKLDPNSPVIEHNLGLTYFRLERYAEARAPLERAAALRPGFFGSNALLGATLYALREDEAAYRVLEHAHQLNPQDDDTATLLYKTALLLAKNRYAKRQNAECLGYLRKAAELRPDDAETHRRLAQVYAILGQPNQAEQEKRLADRLAAEHQ
jgi:tetratricopeptide (TPR) repeat protein